MFVRLKTLRKVSTEQYRLTLDVVDPEWEHWSYGDCQFQVDLWDEPSHRAQPRGPLGSAFDLYRLSPTDPPAGTEAKFMWEVGQVIAGFIDRIFKAGIVCPFRAEAPADAQEPLE